MSLIELDSFEENSGEADLNNMGIMSKKTAAYLAGLIDEEGYIEIQKKTKKRNVDKKAYVPRLRISSANKDIIEWLKNSFGGYIEQRNWKKEGNYKSVWTWYLLHRKVKPVIDAVYPYLRIKKRQAEIVKKFLKTYNEDCRQIVENKSGHGKEKHKELLEKIRNYRDKLYCQIRSLNH